MEKWINNERRARSKIMQAYGKRRSDFETESEWDDYLEEIEDKIEVLTDVHNKFYSKE
jgi:hypothetical protein